MTAFTYGDFYDVPRQIVLKYKDRLYVLLSAFDDQLDDYPDRYQVFLVPLASRKALSIPGQQFLSRCGADRREIAWHYFRQRG